MKKYHRWLPQLLLLSMLLLILIPAATACSNRSDDGKALSTLDPQLVKLVIYQGMMYRVTESTVDAQDIGASIGSIQSSSTEKGEHAVIDAFSNAYPIGTGLYQIEGQDTGAAIAVQSNGSYWKAVKR